MSEKYELYCKREDYDALWEHLRHGVEVENSLPAENGLSKLTVIPKKKRGRKKQLSLNLGEIKEKIANGTSVIEIARNVGCTDRYIWKLLKEERKKQHDKQ